MAQAPLKGADVILNDPVSTAAADLAAKSKPGGRLNFSPYGSPAITRLESAQVSAVKNETQVGSRSADVAPKKAADSKSAPGKADAAPAGNTSTVFTGLCDALNQFQKTLVKPGGYEIADEYEIQFNPQSIASSSVALKGTAYKATPSVQKKEGGESLNQEKQRMDTTNRIIQVGLGTQIVQFIDQVMRSSSYITNQSNFIISETTGKPEPKPNAPADAEVTWYKINFQAKNLGWDKGRNDYAYKMIYTITPFSINRMDSQYFPEGRYHGVHKSYNYWFTGKNNAIINFEQDYNNMYYNILSGIQGGVGNGTTVPAGLTNVPNSPSTPPIGKTNSTSASPKSYAPATSQSNQGAANAANEIGASAADYLYSIVPQGEVKMRIIGDPAWIAQGEVTNSINAATMTFAPFLPDGTINMDAGEVMFDVYFNRPSDYNFDTGIVNVNGQTKNPNGTLAALQPQAHLTYVCSGVKSFFNNGKFEQELTGKAYMDGFTQASEKSPQGQAAAREKSAAVGQGTRNAQLAKEGYDEASKSVAGGNGTWDGESPSNNTAPAGDINNPATQSAAPAEPPTSNGDIAYQNTLQASLNAGDITREQALLIGYKPVESQKVAAGDDANGKS